MCLGIDVGCDFEEIWGPREFIWCPVDEGLVGGSRCVSCGLVEVVYDQDDVRVLRCGRTSRLVWVR